MLKKISIIIIIFLAMAKTTVFAAELVFIDALTLYGTTSSTVSPGGFIQIGTVSNSHIWRVDTMVVGAGDNVYLKVGTTATSGILWGYVTAGHPVKNLWVSGVSGTNTIYIASNVASVGYVISYVDYRVDP